MATTSTVPSFAKLAVRIGTLGLWWQECCENPLFFCYRMGWSLLAVLRERSGGDATYSCSIPSHSYCTISTTSRD
jgi:hypothetical protein